jgi:hypothetical protein
VTLAAGGGRRAAGGGRRASLRDLMERMSHDSVRAAMIYQHKTSTAGQAITDAISSVVRAAQTRAGDDS